MQFMFAGIHWLYIFRWNPQNNRSSCDYGAGIHFLKISQDWLWRKPLGFYLLQFSHLLMVINYFIYLFSYHFSLYFHKGFMKLQYTILVIYKLSMWGTSGTLLIMYASRYGLCHTCVCIHRIYAWWYGLNHVCLCIHQKFKK